MRLPIWEEFARVEEQLDVLEYPLNESLFVVGPPGSGKTVLAVQRAQMLTEIQSDVLIVTYNRMLRRLVALMVDDGVISQTMQSFVWFDYQDRMGEQPPYASHDPFAYMWSIIMERMKLREVRPNRPHLIVDEGQDLPPGFFKYASGYVARNITVFADEDQALRRDCTTLEQIKQATGLNNPKILSQNHRNTPEISRLAEHFHSGRLPAATVHRSSSGELPRLVRSENVESTVAVVSNWYQNRGGSIGVIVDRNQTGRILQKELARRLSGVRIDVYRHDQRNEDAINVLQDGVTVVNKESAKGLEFDTVFIVELDRFIPCTDDAQRRALYMMFTRARDNLLLLYGPGELSTLALAALPGADTLERP